jgi:hypothetical protein
LSLPSGDAAGRRGRFRFLKRLISDGFLGILSGVLGGVFSAVFLVAFSDDLRDLAIKVRTVRPPHHVLRVYDPRTPSDVPTKYNIYGVRENDNFEGIFGKRNDDGTTDFDISFRFKGFARDGAMYFTYAPVHSERFGAGQFQSITRLDRDRYVGLVVGQACDSSGTNSIQRILVGVLTETDQQDDADKAAKTLLESDLKPLYGADLSRRDCKYNPSSKP